MVIILLMGAHVEVARHCSHGLAPALGIFCERRAMHAPFLPVPAMTIDSLEPGHWWSPSGSQPGHTDILRDHPAYRIGMNIYSYCYNQNLSYLVISF